MFTHTKNSLIENQSICQKSCAYTDNNSFEQIPVCSCLFVSACTSISVCATGGGRLRIDADTERLFVKALFRAMTTPRELLTLLLYPLHGGNLKHTLMEELILLPLQKWPLYYPTIYG
ncbi:hypothetical protein PAMP_014439 [Pampus punctatissimus]